MKGAVIVWILLMVLALLGSAKKDGEPREGVNSFSEDVCAYIIINWLVWWGGFFS